MAPVPATIANDVGEKIEKLYLDRTHYFSPTDERYVEACVEADKLSNVDAAIRSCFRARLSALTGDLDEAKYFLNNARRLHGDAEEHDLAQITVLMTLGYYSECTPLIRACGEPERNLLNMFLSTPPTSGLFHLMQEFHERAIQMNLTNVPEFPEAFRAVVPIMDSWGETDDDYAAALDFAGKVMRKRRLFSTGGGLHVEAVTAPADGGPPYVKLALTVDVDLETSIEMTCEYGELLAHSGVKIPQSMIFEFQSAHP